MKYCSESWKTYFILTKWLITSLFFRLFDNALTKTYFFCGGRGDKKAFKETKVCGVIASKSILFLERFFLLSQKLKCIDRVGVLRK